MSSLRFACSPLLLAATPLLPFAALAPASANELASLNSRDSINGYMEQQEIDELKAWRSHNQVTSVNQFSDVRPTDWAYQALSNLVEKYGCVAGYPNGTYKGGQAMTRYEAAALLNACLDRVTEVTDELQRLMDEFKKELAVLKGPRRWPRGQGGHIGSPAVLHYYQAFGACDVCRRGSGIRR